MGTNDIRAALERAATHLSEHPEEARYTDAQATAKLEEGLRVRVDGPGGESIATDMPESVGGTNSAPSPGWVFRASLAACEATLIAMRAAAQNVALSGLAVTVDSESDDRGILGIDAAVPAGPLSVRIKVSGASPEPDAGRLRELVEWAHAHCPVQDAAQRAVPVSIEIEIEADPATPG